MCRGISNFGTSCAPGAAGAKSHSIGLRARRDRSGATAHLASTVAALHTCPRQPRPNDTPPREIVRPNVRRLLEWLDTPAVVVGRGTAVLAANPLFDALIADFSARSARKRYYAHWLFLDPAAREMLLDWEPFARETVGVLRASVTRFPADSALQRLVEELLAGSAAFRALWDRHDAAAPTSGQKRYRHRVAGEMTVLHEATQLPDDQWLYLYWVERGSPSEQAMNRLRASAAGEDS
ncbi:MAG TPA: hypothetical protein VFI54_01070 [Solirubrobacteraceae bacterium]|nr:hypothetical protein [Solirubrobacteraceae bacterium]